MALFRGITKLPLEVYPIVFMMSCALGFGGYVASTKMGHDADLRIRPNGGLKSWEDRLAAIESASAAGSH
ncbi:hypothetical protein HK105_205175 [Polyrhizophydium stewartii]|uniref:NADH dehydrogenase [ubiquinone] 1 alpha subcomplex subunit 1 n=1 Tax=Polyrhizophydium stewartii TaxID=2732419 RepID=A0ABR4N6X4_9FUNG